LSAATPRSEIEKNPPEVARSAHGVAPWYPPPDYPPPRQLGAGRTDTRAIASLLIAVAGVVLGIPLGIPGMVLGTLAYFLGKSSVRRIDASEGALGGRSQAVSAWVLGIVAMIIGSVVTLIWLVVFLFAISQPATTL
jgi:hypothetical protein